MKKPKLLPCPFCGAEAEFDLIFKDIDTKFYFLGSIMCVNVGNKPENCGARMLDSTLLPSGSKSQFVPVRINASTKVLMVLAKKWNSRALG